MLRVLPAFVVVLALGCGARTGLEPPDAAVDGPRDASADTPRDARDAAVDAGDAGRCPIGLDDRIDARIVTSVDDESQLFVNGALIDGTPRIWSTVGDFGVVLFRHPSRANVIAIEGRNVLRIDGRDRGVLAELRVATEAGEERLVTDAGWRLTTVEEPSWFAVDHDDTRWATPTLEATHGDPPWGFLFDGGSTARWLWSYDSNLPAARKPERETVFVRRTFFFDLAGRIVDEPSPCP